MPTKPYRLVEGSLHDRFMRSRNKVQIFGGGFANGKTTALVIKALGVAKDYPGANMLLARSTYPKLNDTLRKAFFQWCPSHWIKSFNKSDNVVILTNGTTINFRYIAQQGSDEHSSSNLLSATYDFIGVDQVEDPEIVHKDFLDLLGRLRGDARYRGDDPTMPKTGPRWVVLCCNPARNWLYRELIKPLHEYNKFGKVSDNLLFDIDAGKPLIDLFEGSTYENQENLEADFIKTLEASYTGQMRDRFLLGQWAAYEGLIYPQFDYDHHVVPHEHIMQYYYELIRNGYQPTILEGYDYGMAVESCYLWGFVDHKGNTFIVAGFYQKEFLLDDQAKLIRKIRNEYGAHADRISADPAIFRRTSGGAKTIGFSIAGLFQNDYGIMMERGNNDILAGITKMQGYLNLKPMHAHPLYGTKPGSHIYFSSELEFVHNEFSEYYWKKSKEDNIDKPIDKNDHAMDTLKYMLSKRPRVAKLLKRSNDNVPGYMKWHETSTTTNPRVHRYG